MRLCIGLAGILAFAPVSAFAQGKPLATKQSPKSVLLTGIQTKEGAEALGERVERRIAAALGRRPEFRKLSTSEVGAGQAELEACRGDTACFARLSTQIDVDYILSGSVGQVGKDIFFQLALLSRQDAEVIERVAATARTPKALLAQIPRVVAQTFRYGGGERLTFRLPDRAEFSIGVFGVEVADLDPAVGDNLVQVLSTEFKKIRGARVISQQDIATVVKAEKCRIRAGGDVDAKCMANIAGAFNVRFLVVGQVALLNSTYIASLQLIAPRTSEVKNRVTVSFRGPEEELVRAMRTLGRKLLNIDTPQPGRLLISGPVSGAAVAINSSAKELTGELPMKPQDEVPSGRLSVRITKDGYYDWESDVFVQPAETTAVWAELQEVPVAWYEKWWVWGIVGAVVAAGTTTAVVLANQPPETGSGELVIQ